MMAGDSEKRFQKVMDKLYHSPSSKTKPPLPRGRRVPDAGPGGRQDGLRLPRDSIGLSGMNSPCRPWDRGDLMRRLATFKAMTWFGKPEAVSPLNCARRGWVNVEMDTIACEACGARLLFSAPSSWTLQQVEKTAAVFSLKLDNGHKLLCPWIDNVCDEALALFPSTPSAVLVEGCKERASLLLRLSALPAISSSAIEYMKSPQLECFLSQTSFHLNSFNNGFMLTEGSGGKDLENTCESAFSAPYYQAQKIISLCGWEPRLLPYVVNHEDQACPVNDSPPSGSSAQTHIDQTKDIIIYPSSGTDDAEVGSWVHQTLGEYEYDPDSVVLDCRFCGACVGLWAFATIPRPLELFKVIASSDMRGQSDLATSTDAQSGTDVSRLGETGSKRSFSLTIAGGPPPMKQKYKPRISFPIISRHLRAQFGLESGLRNFCPSRGYCMNTLGKQHLLQVDESSQDENNHGDLIHGGAKSLKRKRFDDEVLVSGNRDVIDLSQSKSGLDGATGDLITEKNNVISSAGADSGAPHSVLHDSIEDSETQVNSSPKRTNDACAADGNSKYSKEPPLAEGSVGDCAKVGEGPSTTSNITMAACVEPQEEHGNSVLRKKLDHEKNTPNNHHDSSDAASLLVLPRLAFKQGIESGEGNRAPDFQRANDAEVNYQEPNGLRNIVPISTDREADAAQTSGINLKAVMDNKILEFDPIRQHRPFCPWIAPVDGKSMPGWKLALSALVHQERDSSHPLQSGAPPASLDEVDDPIVSIRKLFMSPASKKLKSSH